MSAMTTSKTPMREELDTKNHIRRITSSLKVSLGQNTELRRRCLSSRTMTYGDDDVTSLYIVKLNEMMVRELLVKNYRFTLSCYQMSKKFRQGEQTRVKIDEMYRII